MNQHPRNTKNKVLMLLTNGFEPDPRVYNEAKSLVKNNYKVTIIAWDRKAKLPQFQQIDGIKIERIHLRSNYRKGTSQLFFIVAFWIKTFFKAIRKDFQIVHCHDLDTLPIGFILSKLLKKKLVFDAHENYTDMLGSNVLPIVKKIAKFIEIILVKHVDLLITVGELLEKEYKKYNAKNTCVVGNWKSIGDFQFSDDKIKEERKKVGATNKLVVSFIGYLNEDRKILPLIEATKKDDSIFVLLAGLGSQVQKIKKEIKNLKNVVYLGFLPPEKIPLCTALSDVIYYVLDEKSPNAKYSAPNKLFEALAAGKAIITGNHGEIGKIVQEEKCGIVLHNLSQKELSEVFKKLKQKEILRRYQHNALKAAKKKYNWAFAEQILLNAYRSLLAPL